MATFEIPALVKLEYRIEIPNADPVAKTRARSAVVNGKIRVYDNQTDQKTFFKYVISQHVGNRQPLDLPIFLQMYFFMRRPKNHYGTGRNDGVLKLTAPAFHSKKPDEDNLSKFIKDAMSGIVYRDDALVVGALTWKAYAQNGGMRIDVFSLT